jgi:hypothetical protein
MPTRARWRRPNAVTARSADYYIRANTLVSVAPDEMTALDDVHY